MLHWEHTAIQNTSARHFLRVLIIAPVIMALFLLQNHFLEMLYFLAGNVLKRKAQVRENKRVDKVSQCFLFILHKHHLIFLIYID